MCVFLFLIIIIIIIIVLDVSLFFFSFAQISAEKFRRIKRNGREKKKQLKRIELKELSDEDDIWSLAVFIRADSWARKHRKNIQKSVVQSHIEMHIPYSGIYIKRSGIWVFQCYLDT